jgi:uncharacterized damage-inducible protein DinB
MEYKRQLFEYDANFSREVIKALGTVDKTRLNNERISAWGSPRNLAVRLIEAEDYWINMIVQGKTVSQYAFEDYTEFDTIADKWHETDTGILRFLDSPGAADPKREVRVKRDMEYAFPLEQVLLHFYTHMDHHRGRIVAGMKAHGGRVPCVDII